MKEPLAGAYEVLAHRCAGGTVIAEYDDVAKAFYDLREAGLLTGCRMRSRRKRGAKG